MCIYIYICICVDLTIALCTQVTHGASIKHVQPYIYIHIYTYAYVYNTVVTRCPLWSFPYRIHTRILCWDPHRIHTRIHIGIHTAIAKHKPGFVGQLTTTLGVSFATRNLGSEPVLKTGPARRTAGGERWQTDTHLMRTLILRVSTQCNATTKLLAQKAKHKVARCKTAQPRNACLLSFKFGLSSMVRGTLQSVPRPPSKNTCILHMYA